MAKNDENMYQGERSLLVMGETIELRGENLIEAGRIIVFWNRQNVDRKISLREFWVIFHNYRAIKI
jgi:hypothetical protein